MSFDIKDQPSKANEDQLSLLDFQMQQAAFEESSPGESDYHTWALAHQEPKSPSTPRFLTLSATVHIAAAVLIAVMSVPLVEKAKTETVTIELEDTAPPMALGAAVPASQGGTPAPESVSLPAPEVEAVKPSLSDAKLTSEDVIAESEKPAAKPAQKVKASTPKVAAAKISKSSHKAAPQTNFKAVPATIDDLDSPSLDEGNFAETPMKAHLDEDFSADLDQVDAAENAKLAQEKGKLDSIANNFASEQEQELNALHEQVHAEASEQEAAAAELKDRNAKAIASAVAAEKAEAERAAKAKAASAAATAAAAKAKALEQAEAQGNGQGKGVHGQSVGQGAGNSGESLPQFAQAGAPQGVRSLDQLRQMPGNPRPQYDRDERTKGHQGEVAYLAYISTAGTVEKLKLIKSTGHTNLDDKTLAALKKWRFYPGQEGWVELPFKWEIKGGAEQDGGMLRAAISEN